MKTPRTRNRRELRHSNEPISSRHYVVFLPYLLKLNEYHSDDQGDLYLDDVQGQREGAGGEEIFWYEILTR